MHFIIQEAKRWNQMLPSGNVIVSIVKKQAHFLLTLKYSNGLWERYLINICGGYYLLSQWDSQQWQNSHDTSVFTKTEYSIAPCDPSGRCRLADMDDWGVHNICGTIHFNQMMSNLEFISCESAFLDTGQWTSV